LLLINDDQGVKTWFCDGIGINCTVPERQGIIVSEGPGTVHFKFNQTVIEESEAVFRVARISTVSALYSSTASQDPTGKVTDATRWRAAV